MLGMSRQGLVAGTRQTKLLLQLVLFGLSAQVRAFGPVSANMWVWVKIKPPGIGPQVVVFLVPFTRVQTIGTQNGTLVNGNKD